MHNYYFVKKLKTNKIVDIHPSAICPVFNPLTFEPPKSISVPVQATKAKATFISKSTVMYFTSST
jgi:hypothetical protein